MTSTKTKLRRAAAVVAALATAALVLTNATGRSGGWSEDPILGRSLSRLNNSIAAGEGAQTALLGDVYRHSIWSPFSSEPFIARGIEAGVAGQQWLARKAFDEAIKRDPRSVTARLLLAEQKRKSGDVRGATRETVALLRLMPQSGTAIARPLAELAGHPDAGRIVTDLLVETPALQAPLFAYLADSDGSEALMIDLALRLPPAREMPVWIEPVAGRLIARGKVGPAKAIWSRHGGSDISKQTVVNNSFATGKGLPPFNWKLASGPDGIAEYGKSGGLEVSFFGRNNLRLASQTLTLAPGRYRLTTTVQGDPGSATWTIGCAGAANPLGRSALKDPAQATPIIEIAAACPVQTMALDIAAEDTAATRHFTISSVRLERQ